MEISKNLDTQSTDEIVFSKEVGGSCYVPTKSKLYKAALQSTEGKSTICENS